MDTADQTLIHRLVITFGAGVIHGIISGMREHRRNNVALARYRGMLFEIYLSRGGDPASALKLGFEVQRIALLPG